MCPGWVDDGQEGKQRDQDLGLVLVQSPSGFKSLKVTWPSPLPLCGKMHRCRRASWSLTSSFLNQVAMVLSVPRQPGSWVTGAISQGLFCQTSGQFEHQVWVGCLPWVHQLFVPSRVSCVYVSPCEGQVVQNLACSFLSAYLLASLGLCCCTWALSSWRGRASHCVAAFAKHGLQVHRLGSCGTQVLLP